MRSGRRAGRTTGWTVAWGIVLLATAIAAHAGAFPRADLTSRDGNARRKAVEALAADPPPDAVTLLARVYRAEREDAHGVKAACAKALGVVGTSDAAGPLGEMLGDRDYWVRKSAARALGLVSGQAAVKALVRAARDEDPRVRVQVLAALGRRGEGVEVIRTALDDPDERVAAAALGALDATGAREATECLVGALGAGSWRVRLRAAGCLTRRGDPRGIEVLDDAVRKGDHLSAVFREWSRAGEPGVGPLADLYDDTGLGPPVRTRIVETLARIVTPTATGYLLDLADRASAPGGDRAVAALALYDRRTGLHPAQIGRVAGWLDDDDPNLVGVALQILLEVGDGAALEQIAPLAAHTNPVVRHFALSNLVRYGGQRYEPRFIEALSDPKGANVRLALDALEQYGTPVALSALEITAGIRKYRRYAEAAMEAIESRR